MSDPRSSPPACLSSPVSTPLPPSSPFQEDPRSSSPMHSFHEREQTGLASSSPVRSSSPIAQGVSHEGSDPLDLDELHHSRSPLPSSTGSAGVSNHEEDGGQEEDSKEHRAENHATMDTNHGLSLDEGCDHDDARDVMNVPPSYVAPSHRPEDLEGILAGNREPTEPEVKTITKRRAVIEAALHSGDLPPFYPPGSSVASTTSDVSAPNLATLQKQAGAVPLASGVVVVDREKLDSLISTIPSSQVEIQKGSDDFGEGVQGSPQSEPKSSVNSSFYNDASRHDNIVQPTPAPTTRPRSGSKRVSIADTPEVMDTPFTSTLKYYMTMNERGKAKGKENSPIKTRRNASLPEELAELNREANSDGDNHDLDQYREADLAPLDFVMDSENAGDLMMANMASPASNYKREATKNSVINGTLEEKNPWAHVDGMEQQIYLGGTTASKSTTYELAIPDHNRQTQLLKIETNGSPKKIGEYMRQRSMELDAREEDIEEAVESFLDEPSSFIVNDGGATLSENEGEEGSAAEEAGVEHPVFVKVISMVPTALFWLAMKGIANFSNMAYESLWRGFSRLTVRRTNEGLGEDDH